MASVKVIFYPTCLFLGETANKTYQSSSVHQESSFISANVGERIILRCYYKGHMIAVFYWYKQTLGQKPKIISTFYKYDKNAAFYGEHQNNTRFTLNTEIGNNHFIISDLRISDSATYFCASSFSIIFEFAESVTVSVKGFNLNIQASVYQSASETIQPGGSVTLNCTVQTGTCDREPTVYWFKNEDESHSRISYAHGGRNDQCGKKPNTQTQTCVYNLPLKSLNLTDAGTYYCAVASCGHILFGNGTKLDFEQSLVLVYFLSGALAFTTILTLLLASLLYMTKRSSYQTTESHAIVSASSTVNAETYKTEENLHYAAVRVKKANRSRRHREETEDKCLYSIVKA